MNNFSSDKLKQIFKNNCVWGKLEFQHFKKAVSEILEEIERDTCKWKQDGKTVWHTECGNTLENICPCCGNVIEVVNE